jgi:outer membrane lipase/esterase
MSAVQLPSVPAFQGLVVFGDSLSDIGNAGRFADGPIWVEHVARELGLPPPAPSSRGGFDYAVGGARMGAGDFSLTAQVDAHLARGDGMRDLSGKLVIVWGGANDLLSGAGAETALAGLERLLGELVAAGATTLLVPNLPDLARVPAVRQYGDAAAAAGRAASQAYNAGLGRLLDRVQATRGVRILRLDVAAAADRVAADPAAAGFRNITDPCPGGGAAAGCDGYLFWDMLHPTAFAHARLAELAVALVSGRRPSSGVAP